MRLRARSVVAVCACFLILGTSALAQAGKLTASEKEKAQSNLTASEQEFLTKIIGETQFEIGLAHLAMDRAISPEVKTYARSILSADPGMMQEAMMLAERFHMEIPSEIPQQLRAEHDKLAALSGHAFDNAYMQYEKNRQTQDLELVRKNMSTTTPEIASFAKAIAPAVNDAVQSASRFGGSQEASSK